jgi:hypothetical protein
VQESIACFEGELCQLNMFSFASGLDKIWRVRALDAQRFCQLLSTRRCQGVHLVHWWLWSKLRLWRASLDHLITNAQAGGVPPVLFWPMWLPSRDSLAHGSSLVENLIRYFLTSNLHGWTWRTPWRNLRCLQSLSVLRKYRKNLDLCRQAKLYHAKYSCRK